MKQKRKGKTLVTSASLSNEFNKLIKQYKISPTEAMRRGVAVMLCEMGVKKYNNPLNLRRLSIITKVMQELDAMEKMEEINNILNKKKSLR